MSSPLVQKLYLQQLPPGLNMAITTVLPLMSNNTEWEVEFDCYEVGKVSINTPPDRYPITVLPSTNQALIVVKYGGAPHRTGFGIHGQVDIGIRIQGTADDVNGNACNIDEKGYISLATSEDYLKGIERPDFSRITYNCGDGAAEVLSARIPKVGDNAIFSDSSRRSYYCSYAAAEVLKIPVPKVGEPADAVFSFVVSANGNKMLISLV